MTGATAPTFRVLHVCTGNICRSPMAELLMRQALADRFGPDHGVLVAGAGTYGGHAGEPMHPPARRILTQRGLAVDGFRARWLQRPMVAEADLVLTATADHRERVLTEEPRALRRTFTLRELARLVDALQADPGWAGLPEADPAEQLAVLVPQADARRAVDRPANRRADDLDDPYGEPDRVYRATADLIEDAVRRILAPLHLPSKPATDARHPPR